VYERVKTEGMVRRGWLGVQLTAVTLEQAQAAGMASPSGVFIEGIYPQPGGSPAARAGMQAGDIVLRWNEAPVKTPDDFKVLVGKCKVGSQASITVFRGGQTLTLAVIVGQRPPLPLE
jgi:serine protease Do